jgi:hypothetical protein
MVRGNDSASVRARGIQPRNRCIGDSSTIPWFPFPSRSSGLFSPVACHPFDLIAPTQGNSFKCINIDIIELYLDRPKGREYSSGFVERANALPVANQEGFFCNTAGRSQHRAPSNFLNDHRMKDSDRAKLWRPLCSCVDTCNLGSWESATAITSRFGR